MLSIILLLVALGCLLIVVWWRGQQARRLAAMLPGWPRLPLVGNLHKFYGGPEVIFRRVVEMSEAAEENNSMFSLWGGTHLIILAFKPEDTKALTNAFIEKPYYYRFARDWLGDGLVTGSGAVWKRNIKNLAGTFTGSVVDGFQDIFNLQAEKLVANFKSDVGSPPFDAMQKYLAYTTLETICQTSLGVANISGSIITSEYYEAFNRTLELLVRRGFNLMLHPDWIYRLTPSYYEFQKCVKILHNVSKTVIARRKKYWHEIKNKNCNLENTNPENKKSKFRPFLDILIEMSETDPLLTDEQIRAEVDTVIVGGQETTASTLFFTLLMLGCNEDIQHKLYNEIKEIFGESSRPVQKEDLSRMQYCEAVLHESLRMFPPIPIVMRYADSDLKLDEYTIPAGTGCGVNAWGAGRSRRLWGPDADRYRPERWLAGPLPPPAAFLAFSYGRRSCIGKKYAFALLKTILAHCVRELVFSSEAQNMEFKYDVALRPTRGHLLQVHLRK